LPRKTQIAGPFFPLSFVLVYQYDMYYSNKLERIRHEAERLIREEPELFFPPNNNGMLSTKEYIKTMNVNIIVKKN
jgi:hypothetical protein